MTFIQSYTILLIEDNSDDELLTLKAFKQSEYNLKIDVARDGLDALNYIYSDGISGNRSKQTLPSLILLDLNIPKINGIEVLQKIKSNPNTKKIPVVILTTSKLSKDIDLAYEHGANSFIVKPIDFNKFTEIIKGIEHYWLSINELHQEIKTKHKE